MRLDPQVNARGEPGGVRVEYLTRADWGGEWVRGPWTEALPDGEAVLHHVGGGARMGKTPGKGYDASRAMACNVFLWLNVYATLPKSEGGKGYSFLDYDALGWYDWVNDIGWIAEGRGMYMSAATRDRNELAEAFCLCGNFSLRQPDPEEVELAAYGIAYMAEQGWTTKTPVIYGHRDNPAHPGATGCPGDHLYPHMSTIEARAREIIAGDDIVVPPPQPPQEADMGLRVAKIRFDSFAEQLVCFRASRDTLETGGVFFDEVTVLPDPTPAQRAAIEEQLGKPLTPLT